MAISKAKIKDAAATYMQPEQKAEQPKENKKPTTFYITPSNYETIQQMAAFRTALGERTSAGQLMDIAISEFIERHQDEIRRFQKAANQMK